MRKKLFENSRENMLNLVKKIDSTYKKSVNESTLNETGEWIDDEEGIAWKNALKNDIEKIQNGTNGKLQLIDVKGFDKYQGPYAIVKFGGRQYKIWTVENDLLWIEDFPVDNTSREGMNPGFMGSVENIINMLNSQQKETSENLAENVNMSSADAIRNYVYFALNYPNDFIDQIWGDEANMAEHLKEKFSSYYKKVGPVGAMNEFFVNLDIENQRQLANWILENYQGI